MSTKRLFITTLVGWPLAVLSALAARTAVIAPGASPVELAAWAFAGCVPVGIALVIARGNATTSVAQVLYDAEQNDSRPAASAAVPRG